MKKSHSRLSQGSICSVHKPKAQPPRTTKSSRSPEQCSLGAALPLCSSDELKSRCPSGCTVQGLLDAAERSVSQRISKICERIIEDENALNRTLLLTKELYYDQRRTIVKHYIAETRQLELQEELQLKLSTLQKRSADLAKMLEAKRSLIRQQIMAMHQTEVDVDIKMRACQGSCRSAFIYHINPQDYESLEDELSKAGQTSGQMWRLTINAGKIQMESLDRNSASLPSYRDHPFIREEFLSQFEDMPEYRVSAEKSAQKKKN
ncbi:fibrinogen alpha chain [Scleropages formosus]|uniref:fibrinogen alpha chain n=1 Tax=Scleropages formosus TaxID=113540 RepID=UPI0010FA848A|nr:fibrinogen alpha chain-like [Scleropages formosus]